ncbi:MAG: putative amidohydrolase [Candidatus Azotimanducaceae bacterium]|jgi:predicted amidohydrolase
MRIALIQMVSSHSVELSLDAAARLLTEVDDKAVDAIFLPENFAALGSDDPYQIGLRERDDSGPIRSFLREAARRAGCWIFAGTMPIANRPDGLPTAPGKVRAASLVFDQHGNEVSRYDKMHMFDVDVADKHGAYRESNSFEHGTDLNLVDSPCGRVGLSVCYDIRFSELYLCLFKQGAELFAIPSAFTEPTGEAHFELLMRARAVESFAYSVAACQGGVHDTGRRTYGHSMVVNPWGEIIAKADRGEAVITANIDLEELRRIRAKMPVLEQRRI